MGDGSRDSKGEGSGEAWRAMGVRVAGASSSRPEMSLGALGRRADDCAVVELVRELMAQQTCGQVCHGSCWTSRVAAAACLLRLGISSALLFPLLDVSSRWYVKAASSVRWTDLRAVRGREGQIACRR